MEKKSIRDNFADEFRFNIKLRGKALVAIAAGVAAILYAVAQSLLR